MLKVLRIITIAFLLAYTLTFSGLFVSTAPATMEGRGP